MMKKTLATAIVLSLFATVAIAQTAAPNAQKPERPARAQIDANGDGVIDRAEAAKFPRLAERFDELDKNKDGKLDASERPQRSERQRGARDPGNARSDRGHRAGRHGHGGRGGPERLDTDGDGRLSRAEVTAAKSGRDGKNRLLEQFDAIDTNRDGYIVRSELRAWHETQRPQREAEMRKRFDERFAAADTNGDGKLSKAEVEAKMPHLARRFAWMDDNRDGFLSREELQPQRRTR